MCQETDLPGLCLQLSPTESSGLSEERGRKVCWQASIEVAKSLTEEEKGLFQLTSLEVSVRDHLAPCMGFG